MFLGIMKAFIVFAIFCAAAVGAEDFCYKDVVQACNPTSKKCKYIEYLLPHYIKSLKKINYILVFLVFNVLIYISVFLSLKDYKNSCFK